MATGWDASIEDTLQSVRACLPQGESRTHCEECGEEIPLARRKAVPGVRLCIPCQEEADENTKSHALYNRRGSTDSRFR